MIFREKSSVSEAETTFIQRNFVNFDEKTININCFEFFLYNFKFSFKKLLDFRRKFLEKTSFKFFLDDNALYCWICSCIKQECTQIEWNDLNRIEQKKIYSFCKQKFVIDLKFKQTNACAHTQSIDPTYSHSHTHAVACIVPFYVYKHTHTRYIHTYL